MNDILHLVIKEFDESLTKIETINLRSIDSLRHIEQKTSIEKDVLINTKHIAPWPVVQTDVELSVIKIKIATFYLNLLADKLDKLQDDLANFIDSILEST